MIILEASSALENAHLIISIVLALITLATTAYAIYQKIKAGDYKGAKEEAEKLLNEGAKAIDKIKRVTEGTDARYLVRDTLKDHGVKLDDLGLKGKMDEKLKQLDLDSGS